MILSTFEDVKKAIINGGIIKTKTILYTENKDISEMADITSEHFLYNIGYYDPKYGVYIGICHNKHIWAGHKDAPEKMDWDDAVKWCRNYNIDNDDDIPYHLPTKEELMLIYANLTIINKSLEENSCGPLKDGWYWSSSEYNGNYAWGQYFYNGSVGYNGKTYGSHYVRPVLALQVLSMVEIK